MEKVKETKQKFISENNEIHTTIKKLLQEAENSIKVATAWFTDEELLNILVQKAEKGVNVEVVIANKEENSKLSFNKLKNEGGSVLIEDNSSYGMMHQKYCIVDDSTAIIGSYNWTINAKTNNKEGVVLTSDKGTVLQMIENFNLFNTNQKTLGNNSEKLNLMKKSNQETIKMEIMKDQGSEGNELKSLFNHIIESEIKDVDLNVIKAKGKDACKETIGGLDTFLVYLDNLKLQFTTDLTLAEDKKVKILASIEELTAKEINNKEKSFEQRIDTVKTKFQEEKSELEKILDEIDNDVLINDAEQKKINLNKIEYRNTEITSFKETLIDLKANLKITSIAWYDLIPKIILGIGLASLVYLFYSSAMYIMLYTSSDVQQVIMNGGIPETPTFFDAEAINKAISKGGTAVFFVCLIPVFLYFFAFLKRFTKSWQPWVQNMTTIVSVIVIDGIIAFIVADTIHHSKYLNNEVQTPSIEFTDAITDLNFLSVLICGVATLFSLKVVVTSIWNDFDKRNQDHVANELKIKVEKINGQINHCKDIIKEGGVEIIELGKELDILKTNEAQSQNKLKEEKLQLEISLEELSCSQEKELNCIIRLADLYKVRVENENLLFDTSFLNQRINSFIEGWDEFLYSYYNQQVADKKVKEVKEAYSEWLNSQNTIKKVA